MRAKPARVMAALRAAFGLDVAEAWAGYRRLKASLEHAPGLVDLTRHPRITAREVRAARLAAVGEEAVALRREIRVPVTKAEATVLREEAEFYEEDIDYVEYEFSADTAGET